jgi:hypothetical protein
MHTRVSGARGRWCTIEPHEAIHTEGLRATAFDLVRLAVRLPPNIEDLVQGRGLLARDRWKLPARISEKGLHIPAADPMTGSNLHHALKLNDEDTALEYGVYPVISDDVRRIKQRPSARP